MGVRIGFLTDLHFGLSEVGSGRRGELGGVLLERAVRRLERWVRPDVVVLGGDMVEAGPGCEERLGEVAGILEGLSCPVVAIRGNHDAPAEVYYRYLPGLGEWLDVKGVRLVGFDDPEEPEYNARRTESDLERMGRAAAGWGGPLVSLQHVPVFPEDAGEDVPYRLVNGGEVAEAMRECGYVLSLSGHFHEGIEPVRRGRQSYAVGPAMCKGEFPYLVVEVEGERVRFERQELAMPRGEELVDCHLHTQWAYCSDNMDVGRALGLLGDFGLAGGAFTEHASHLYFSREQYKSHVPLREGMEAAAAESNRFDEWLGMMRAAGVAAESVGLEVDCDFRGRQVLAAGDGEKVRFLMGSVHQLPASLAGEVDEGRLSEEFLANTAALVGSGVRVLAHPFRVFQRLGVRVPERLYGAVVGMLREHGVAAEVNFHKGRQDPVFFGMCVEAGVKLTLGSDSHHLSQVGELWPHLELLRAIGVGSGFNEVLLDPRRERL